MRRQSTGFPATRARALSGLGNKAADQRQIDVVGELLDALDLMAQGGLEQTDEALAAERDLAGHLERTWQDAGHGLWESRGRPEQYTYSKVMAWVGVDRLLSSHARRGSADDPMLDRMRALRTRIHNEVLERSWNFARGHFVIATAASNWTPACCCCRSSASSRPTIRA